MTEELKKLRIDFKYNQSDVAKLLGFKSTSSYSRKENGEIEFSIGDIKKLKEIFSLSSEEIVKIFFI